MVQAQGYMDCADPADGAMTMITRKGRASMERINASVKIDGRWNILRIYDLGMVNTSYHEEYARTRQARVHTRGVQLLRPALRTVPVRAAMPCWGGGTR